MSRTSKIPETALYPPIHSYLTALGYTVTGEAVGCDVAAVHKEDVIAVELKSSINLKLIMQAVERQEACDSVYIAVPAEGSSYPAHFSSKLRVIKRLGLGLLLVRFLSHRTRVELICHPEIRERRMNTRRRKAILRELHGRSGDYTQGGTRGKGVTAYREEALFLALLLSRTKQLSPAECRAQGGSQKAGAILCDNHYGWFERVSRGTYTLHDAGRQALKEYSHIVKAWAEKSTSDQN